MLDTVKRSSFDVRVYDNKIVMGQHAAELVSRRILELLDSLPFVNILFAAAPSQNDFLAALCKRQGIDWSRINAFHMDEYLNLAADAPQGFGNFLKERLFSKLPFHSVHYINGNTSDVAGECARYSDLLKSYTVHIACMGIGENGHLAFNDPPVADFNDPELVKRVELDITCRQQQVNDGCFSSLDDVPHFALTLTIPALMSAPYIYCIVPGEAKVQAVYNTVNKQLDEQYPSTILRKHSNVILFLDKESSSLL